MQQSDTHKNNGYNKCGGGQMQQSHHSGVIWKIKNKNKSDWLWAICQGESDCWIRISIFTPKVVHPAVQYSSAGNYLQILELEVWIITNWFI